MTMDHDTDHRQHEEPSHLQSFETDAGPTVSIVIRTLNEAAHIGRLLATIASQSTQPDETIVVDSGSTDGTVEIAESFGAIVVHIPPNEFTFGRSLNLGCSSAKGDILIALSAHVYPLRPTWLDDLVEPFSDPGVAISYGGQTGDHRSNFAEIRLLRGWFPDEPNPDQKDPFCNNANCAVRREVWETNPYDESLPGLEDLAFAKDALAAGHKISYVPSARIAHVHEERFAQTLNRYRREAMAYKKVFGGTDLNLLRSIGLAATSIGSDAAAAARSKQPGVILRAASFRIAQFAGAYLGNRTQDEEMKTVVRRMYYPSGG